MTITEYREKYGAEFNGHSAQPWFMALVQTLNDEHPLRSLRTKKDGEMLNGAVVYLNQIHGYEECLSKLSSISKPAPKEEKEIPSTYQDDEIPVQLPS